jgi:hypothetical protein
MVQTPHILHKQQGLGSEALEWEWGKMDGHNLTISFSLGRLPTVFCLSFFVILCLPTMLKKRHSFIAGISSCKQNISPELHVAVFAITGRKSVRIEPKAENAESRHESAFQ